MPLASATHLHLTTWIHEPSPAALLSGIATIRGDFLGDGWHTADYARFRVGNSHWYSASICCGAMLWQYEGTVDTRRITNGNWALLVETHTEGYHPTNASRPVQVYNPPYYDLEMTWIRAFVEDHVDATISLSVRNAGTREAPPSTALVEYSTATGYRELRTIAIPALPIGTQTGATFSWPYDYQIGRFDLRATVDPADLLQEDFENNNDARTSITFFTSAAPGIWTAETARDVGGPSPPPLEPDVLDLIELLDVGEILRCLRDPSCLY